MKAIAWITDPVAIGRILDHRRKAGLESPFDARGPPTTSTQTKRVMMGEEELDGTRRERPA